MTQDSYRRLRYAGFSINLFGMLLSIGTWAYRMWLRTHTVTQPYHTDLAWTLGGFCWLLGLLLFVRGWVGER
jgi:hypothetical protein